MTDTTRQKIEAEVEWARDAFDRVLPGQALGYPEALAWTLGRRGLMPDDYRLLDKAITLSEKEVSQ